MTTGGQTPGKLSTSGKDPRPSAGHLSTSGKDPRGMAAQPGKDYHYPSPRPGAPRRGNTTRTLIVVGVVFLLVLLTTTVIYVVISKWHDMDEANKAADQSDADDATKHMQNQLETEMKELKNMLSVQDARIKKLESDLVNFSSTVNTFNQRMLMNSH